MVFVARQIFWMMMNVVWSERRDLRFLHIRSAQAERGFERSLDIGAHFLGDSFIARGEGVERLVLSSLRSQPEAACMLLQSAPRPGGVLEVERVGFGEVIVGVAEVRFRGAVNQPITAVAGRKRALAVFVALQHVPIIRSRTGSRLRSASR